MSIQIVRSKFIREAHIVRQWTTDIPAVHGEKYFIDVDKGVVFEVLIRRIMYFNITLGIGSPL